MKKRKDLKNSPHINVDLEQLKHWKKVSTKGKLDWLESALRFGKLKKF
jgi:hypothetical protein